MKHAPARLSLLLMATGVALFAHATWIAAKSGVVKAGETVKVRIGNGHGFPESESAIATEGLRVYAVASSGKKSDVAVIAAGPFLEGTFVAKEGGVHRVVMVRDRGVISRTPRGVKPGGRDKNPDATQSMKSYSSAVTYAGDAGMLPRQPLGLVFEAIAQREKDAVTVLVLRDGKPCGGAQVQATWEGQKEQLAGETGADGKLRYRLPAGAKGAFLLVAGLSEKAGAGDGFDTRNYSATLRLTR